MNIYRREHNKPMIYSLASAEKFLEETKNEFQLYLGRGNYLIVNGGKSVKIVMRSYAGEIGIDFVAYQGTEKAAARKLYELRKYINNYFRG